MIPASVERRARWVLDSIGAREVGFGDDVPYRAEAWERLEHGERPGDDGLADAFFHLARLEERRGARDEHGRFPATATCLDPLDPPLERLRRRLGIEPPRWRGARFAVALTHDVDVPWRWTRIGMLGAAARLKGHLAGGRRGGALREVRALAAVPLHKLRRSDPNWTFEHTVRAERRQGASSTFFLLAAHRHSADGASPESYERLRGRVVETLLGCEAEIGLHPSYLAAEDAGLVLDEKRALETLAGDVFGARFHYLRLDAHRHPRELAQAGFRYDATLGFPDALGFRAGIAQPFRPWDVDADRPVDLVEVPLAAMDVTLAETRYLGLSAAAAKPRLDALLDWAAANGGGFSILWHPDRFDRWTAEGWDRLYDGLMRGARERGGVCVSAGELAAEAAEWLPPA